MYKYLVIYGQVKGINTRSLLPFNKKLIKKALHKYNKVYDHITINSYYDKSIDVANSKNFLLKMFDKEYFV